MGNYEIHSIVCCIFIELFILLNYSFYCLLNNLYLTKQFVCVVIIIIILFIVDLFGICLIFMVICLSANVVLCELVHCILARLLKRGSGALNYSTTAKQKPACSARNGCFGAAKYLYSADALGACWR